MLNGKQIMNRLKQKLIGQDDYVRQLSILGYKHMLNQKLIAEGKTPINNNLLVVGPTGTGKTFGAKQLANILDIPFYEVDCANLVQTGYKGTTSVENILKDAKGMLGRKIEHGIVYLDEFDKVFDPCVVNRGDGPAQMQNFLKLLEPNIVTVDRERNYITQIDTSGITYIATGSFDYVRKKNQDKNRMGFESSLSKPEAITKEDIISVGYLPELIGRFATLINLNPLTEADYYRILLDSKDSAYTQYQEFFKASSVRLNIHKKVLENIARKANEMAIGARGLSQALNQYLDECVFEVSNDSTISGIELRMKDGKIVPVYSYAAKEAKTHDK